MNLRAREIKVKILAPDDDTTVEDVLNGIKIHCHTTECEECAYAYDTDNEHCKFKLNDDDETCPVNWDKEFIKRFSDAMSEYYRDSR